MSTMLNLVCREAPRYASVRAADEVTGNAVLAADLARFHVARVAAAQQHDGVVLAAGAGLAHQPAGGLLPTDMNSCLVVTGQLPWVAGAPGWRSQSMSARKGFYVLVVIDLRLLGGRKNERNWKSLPGAKLKALISRKRVFARLGGHDGLPFHAACAARACRRRHRLSMLWHLT